MTTSDDGLAVPFPNPANVVQAIANVKAMVGGIPKLSQDERRRLGLSTGGDGGGGISYAYRSIDQIASVVQPWFGQFGVVFTPNALPKRTVVEEVTVGSKPWRHITIYVEWHVYGPGGVDDKLTPFVTIGEGRDNSDKGMNKAQTMAYKNALLRVLDIGDPQDDTDHSRFETEAHQGPTWEDLGWRDKDEHDTAWQEVKATAATVGEEHRDELKEFWNQRGGVKLPLPRTDIDAYRTLVQGMIVSTMIDEAQSGENASQPAPADEPTPTTTTRARPGSRATTSKEPPTDG